MKRPWLYYISPTSILAGLFFILIIAGFFDINDFLEEGNNFFVFFSFFTIGVIILILTAIWYAVRFATNGKVLYIWLVEAAIIAIPVIGYLMDRQGY